MRKEKEDKIINKLNEFIIKYYKNQLLKGLIYFVSILLVFFLVFSSLEYYSQFNQLGRAILFWLYIFINLLVFVRLIFVPLLQIFRIGHVLSHKEAALIIGKHFSEIDDKLLNLLQLKEMSNSENSLVVASIEQKTKKLSPIPFKNAIDLSLNKKHLKWLYIPGVIIFLFIISGKKHILSESSARIVQYNTNIPKTYPYKYVLLNNNLNCNEQEDFSLKLKIEGDEKPEELFIFWGGSSFKMKQNGKNRFSYDFTKVKSNIKFTISANEGLKKTYEISLLKKPKIIDLSISITPPKHTNQPPTSSKGGGDLIVYEGSQVTWDVKSKHSDLCIFNFQNKIIKESKKSSFSVDKLLLENSEYNIICKNSHATDTISFFIEVIKDDYPKINIESYLDTINNTQFFSGIASDDYLVDKLELIYEFNYGDNSQSVPLKVEKKKIVDFNYQLNIDSLNIPFGEKIIYYFKVWDNDETNGAKFTKSQYWQYEEKTDEQIISKKDSLNQKSIAGFNESIDLTEEIKKEIEKLKQIIIEEKNIDWKSKNKIKDLIEKQKKLENLIKENIKRNQSNIKQQEKINSSLLEKQKQIQELMKEMLDEDVKSILEELEKMLDEKDKEKIKGLLEKIDEKNNSLEKELDRDLELLKQLDFEQKFNEAIDQIDKLKKDQEKLIKDSEENKKQNIELEQDQEEISKDFEKLQKNLEDLREKNMQLENKNQLPKTQEIEKEIQQEMMESEDLLKNNKKKSSIKKQKQSKEKLESLERLFLDMKQSSTEAQAEEDIHSLRQILENLLKLSHDQEDLIEIMKNTPVNSPEFINIVQAQNEIKRNSLIVEDSLFALSKRVVQIEPSINKEITAIKLNLEKTTKELEERKKNIVAEKQQFVMTSVNNLALLLSEILEQMQKEMPPSDCNTPKNCNKPNPSNNPSMSDLKKAQEKLKKKMEEGKNGKNGKKNSKELMELAKEQEAIKNQLLELRNEMKDKGNIDKTISKMEENERDIINNQITEETLRRQEEILTRLFESENAKREQGKDDKRKAESWQYELSESTKEYIKYKNKKQAQKQLLETTPIELRPFYKKKVSFYFKNLIND